MNALAMFRRQERGSTGAASDHLEIGHALWFSVELKVSEQFLSSFQVF
jgi:hypothetical protein